MNDYGTFNGWKKQGRVVMSGQRGVFRNEYGDKMFSRDQTCLIGGIERITVYRNQRGQFIKSVTVQSN